MWTKLALCLALAACGGEPVGPEASPDATGAGDAASEADDRGEGPGRPACSSSIPQECEPRLSFVQAACQAESQCEITLDAGERFRLEARYSHGNLPVDGHFVKFARDETFPAPPAPALAFVGETVVTTDEAGLAGVEVKALSGAGQVVIDAWMQLDSRVTPLRWLITATGDAPVVLGVRVDYGGAEVVDEVVAALFRIGPGGSDCDAALADPLHEGDIERSVYPAGFPVEILFRESAFAPEELEAPPGYTVVVRALRYPLNPEPGGETVLVAAGCATVGAEALAEPRAEVELEL